MGFEVKILADSISPRGHRLTTMEWTFPRCILAEVNTHRMASRNAASSRAIPVEKLIQRVLDDPFIPEFRQNQSGMQAGELIDTADATAAKAIWLNQRDTAVSRARQLHEKNIHKQYINRLLEPWMWATIIISATEWENIWKLRCHPDAEPSFQRIATMARECRENSKPQPLLHCDWHLPLVSKEDWKDAQELLERGTENRVLINDIRNYLRKVSVGRCARVSYLTHDGKRDIEKDIELHDRLVNSGHWSPFEHVAQPVDPNAFIGNFQGWMQYRKTFAGESGRNA